MEEKKEKEVYHLKEAMYLRDMLCSGWGEGLIVDALKHMGSKPEEMVIKKDIVEGCGCATTPEGVESCIAIAAEGIAYPRLVLGTPDLEKFLKKLDELVMRHKKHYYELHEYGR